MTKRDIKFRQWSERNKEMTSWEFMKKHNLCVSALEYESLLTEQYTGLKDVNGVEIYEGDVLWDAHYEVYGFVVYDEGSFRYIEGSVSELLEEVNIVLEVHGNIHENMELIKETTFR